MKHKILNSIAVLLILTLIRCSSDSEVLASFETGNVTRKELRDYYKIHGAEINEKNASIENQSFVLENISLQKIVYNDFSKSNKVSKDFMDKLINLSKGQIFVSLYKQEFESRILTRTPMELATFQMVVLRPEMGTPDENLGKDILEELNSYSNKSIFSFFTNLFQLDSNSKKINEIIQSKTIDISRKPVNGLLEPFCLNCGVNRFNDLLEEPLKNNDGKFYRTVDGNNVYLIRIVEIKKIHEPVLAKYLEESFETIEKLAKEFQNSSKDPEAIQAAERYSQGNPKDKAKNFADLYSKQFRTSLWEKELTRIREESKIVLTNSPNLSSPDAINPKEWEEDRVLAELPNGDKIQYFPIRDAFREINSKLQINNQASSKSEVWDVFNFFYNNYLPAIYVENDPASKSLIDSEIYNYAKDFLRKSFTWSIFMKEISEEKFTVTEEDIRQDYEIGKMIAYSKPDPANKEKKIPIPYSQVRESIKKELEGKKLKANLDQRIGLLKTEQNLKIAMESLKEGKI